MVIDSHQHVYYNGLDPAGVIAEMDKFGIDVTWLLTWYIPPGEHVGAEHRVGLVRATFDPMAHTPGRPLTK